MLLALDRLDRSTLRLRVLWPYATVAVVAAALFAALCDQVGDRDGITSVDGPVARWFALHRSLGEGHLGLLLAKATSPAVLVALVGAAAVLLWWRRHRVPAVMLVTAVVAAYATGFVAKYGEHRARPLAPINLAPEGEPSFPSGHVLVISTIVGVALLLSWRHLGTVGRVLGVVAGAGVVALIALDRLLVGAHWATDVLGSLTLAAAIVATAAAAWAWWQSPQA